MRRMRSFSVSPSTYSKTMYGAAVLLAGVDDADDVGVAELGDGAGFAAEALELVGVGRDLAVHELDRDAALEHGVEGAVDRRHPARADLGVEPVPAVELHADEGAHPLSCAYCGLRLGVLLLHPRVHARRLSRTVFAYEKIAASTTGSIDAAGAD